MPSNSFEPPTIKPPVYRRLPSLAPPPCSSPFTRATHARIVVATKRHEEQVVVATIDRVCPLTSFRVTTDSSGDIKRQFKNDWTMTHDTCAIDVDLFERERDREGRIQRKEQRGGGEREEEGGEEGGGSVRDSLTSSKDLPVTLGRSRDLDDDYDDSSEGEWLRERGILRTEARSSPIFGRLGEGCYRRSSLFSSSKRKVIIYVCPTMG